MLHPTLHSSLRRLLIVSLLALGLQSVSPVQAAPGAVPPLAPAAPGELDTGFAGFGAGGYVTLPAFDLTDFARQPDGKIVVVGNTPGQQQLLVYRLLPNGQPDPEFGGGDGSALIALAVDFKPSSVGVQSDGGIVVGGTVSNRFALARLTLTGALDTTFGNSGVFTDIGGLVYALQDLLVQPDDKIVAVGRGAVNNGNEGDFAVVRYTSQGFRDATFGNLGGKVLIDFGPQDLARAVIMQPDHKLVVAGYAGGVGFGLARINPNGTLDDNSNLDGGFGGDGKVTTAVNLGIGSADALDLMADGRIVAAGYDFTTGTSYLARYETDGDLDPTFNGTSLQPYTNDFLTDAALLPDGRVLALGSHDANFALHRVTVDGQEDETFGFNNAVVFPDFGGVEDARRLALLPDGRILAAGASGSSSVLFQLWPNGITYDTGGQQAYARDHGEVYRAGSHEYGRALARLPDGRLLVAGEMYTANGNSGLAMVTRFLPTGQVDTSFGIRGIGTVAAGAHNLAAALAMQPDGKIVIAGYAAGTSGVGHDLLIARLGPNGFKDTAFNAGLGYVRIDFGSGHDELYAVALTPPDPATGQVKIVVAGAAYNGAHNVWVVMRLDYFGQPDPTFGPNHDGLAFFDFGPRCGHCAASANAVAVQPDGAVVVAGFVDFDTAIARLTPAGLPDPAFGQQGLTIQDLGGHDGLNALVRAPDGQLYGAGSHAPNGHNDFVVTRFSPGGVLLDHGSADWSSGNDIALSLDWRDDGQLAVGGVANGQVAWAQFSTADVSASPIQGTTDFVGDYEAVTGIQFADNDDVVVAGFQEYQGDWNMALARFKTGPYTPPPPTYSVFLPFLNR